IRERFAALCRRLKRASLRPTSRFVCFRGLNQSRPRQFLQRVVDHWPRYLRPIPNFPPLEFEVGLISVHGPLRQQAKQHQVRRRQRQPSPRTYTPPRFLCLRLEALRLVYRLQCESLSLFLTFNFELTASFLFLLHHHHWHFSTGSRGFLACATAAQNASSTQGSCR